MARKKSADSQDSGVEDHDYWYVRGKPTFRLDLPDYRDQLLVDICAVKTVKQAEEWISERGCLVQKFETAQKTLARAATVRYLRDLNAAVRQSENEQHESLRAWGDVIDMGDEEEQPIGYRAISINYPPRESIDGPAALIFPDTVPVGWSCKSAEYRKDPAKALRHAARHVLRQGVQDMIAGTSIEISSYQRNGEWVLEPFYKVSTPWQAIGLAATKIICAEAFNQRFCRNPNCRAPIVSGRSDKLYCERQYCQKWALKNLGAVRGK